VKDQAKGLVRSSRPGVEMKFKDYLEAKYRSKHYGLSDDEALVIGIPVPLVKGWIEEYADHEITKDAAAKLMPILRRAATASSPRRRDNAQWAIEFLLLGFGREIDAPAAPKKTKKERAKSPVRQKRKERYEQYLMRVKSGPVTTVYRKDQPVDEFLSSYEWRRVRMQALKKYGARCQCCGATPADGVKMNVDHIKPRKLYPQLALDLNNLQVLCELCNHGKGNWDMTDWRGNAEDSGTRSRATAKNDL
jgi:5-methylcytosine-specific restriction endonuclease McrA